MGPIEIWYQTSPENSDLITGLGNHPQQRQAPKIREGLVRDYNALYSDDSTDRRLRLFRLVFMHAKTLVAYTLPISLL